LARRDSMDVEWPLRCISKSPQESVVERSSSGFQEFFFNAVS
jgi:hypothetical protein